MLHQVGSVFASHSWTLGLSSWTTHGEPAIASKSNNRGAQPTNCDRATDSPERAESPEAKPTHATASGRNGHTYYLGIDARQKQDCDDFFEDLLFGDDGVTSSANSATDDDISSLLDHDLKLFHQDSMTIDEIVDRLNEDERCSSSTSRFQGGTQQQPAISPTDAAAAVFRELHLIGAMTPVPLPPRQPELPVIRSSFGFMERPIPLQPNAGRGNSVDDESSSSRSTQLPAGHTITFSSSTTLQVELRKPAAASKSASKSASQSTHRARAKAPRAKKTKARWTAEETRCLQEGVALFGTGKWLKIKQHFAQELEERSNVDLKDRWRNFGGQRQSQKRRRSLSPPLAGGPMAKTPKVTPMMCM